MIRENSTRAFGGDNSIEFDFDSDPIVVDSLLDLEDLRVGIHDQLPSAEECKANLPSTHTGCSPKKWKTCGILSVMLAILVIGFTLAIVVGKANIEERAVTPDEQIEEVIQFLFKHQVTPLPLLEDAGTPQRRAALFLAVGDNFRMELTSDNAARFIERYALAVIWYHFHGQQWNYRLDFMTATDVCEWHTRYYTASGNSINEGVMCDENGYVTKLILPFNGLTGNEIPDEIKWLTKLDTFHIYFNAGIKASGLPRAFKSMPNLKSIGLQYCDISGVIPEWIGDLTQLTSLGLGNNNLQGQVPSSIQKLNQLKLLALDGNAGLTGNINDLFGTMSNLQFLYLDDNAFGDEIDMDVLMKKWPQILELDLSKNMLGGSIPASLMNHPKLMVADLHENLFDGPFPEDIFENNNLEFLDVHANLISGSIADRLGFVKNLKHLDLSINRLEGTIPDTLGMLVDLVYLGTAHNDFAGQTIPDLSKLINLKYVIMQNNKLQGTIPDWIGEFNNLRMLDLGSNELTGSIPWWMGMTENLSHLLLNRNQLTGAIPSQMSAMELLDVFLIAGNHIRGNAWAICDAPSANPSHFVSDCYPGIPGSPREFQCSCCTKCCLEGDDSCNTSPWVPSLDPVWEYGYIRSAYHFDLRNAPEMVAKTNGGITAEQIMPDPIP